MPVCGIFDGICRITHFFIFYLGQRMLKFFKILCSGDFLREVGALLSDERSSFMLEFLKLARFDSCGCRINGLFKLDPTTLVGTYGISLLFREGWTDSLVCGSVSMHTERTLKSATRTSWARFISSKG